MIVAIEAWNSAPAAPVAPPLRPGTVHLWRADLDRSSGCENCLSPAEWIRAERFHFPQDRQRFVIGRSIVRSILASYLDLDPAELPLTTGAHGKPELAGVASALRFNLSHSGDLLLLAVTHAREIGVDLELMNENVPFQALADHYFDPEEAWDLRLLPSDKQAWKFYDVWTCTEARLKAHGVGLTQGMKIVEPNRWSLLKLTPAVGYTAALAVEGGDFELECWSWQK